MSIPKSAADLPEGQNFQLPNNLLNPAFGELNVVKKAGRLEIVVTVLMEPVKEGSQTGVALDGSASMRASYGAVWEFSPTCSHEVVTRMQKEGKAKSVFRDGNETLEWTDAGWTELVNKGYVQRPENKMRTFARDVVPHLAEKIDADGGTTVIYWAAGPRGDAIEEAGDLTAVTAKSAEYGGPTSWGEKTHLLPALKYFVERFADADWGFYVFVTDGRLDDLEAVKAYTADLSRRIGAKQCRPVKCVLIGVGSEVDEKQMEVLDDLPDELDLPVDIWDHKIAVEMRDLRDIFAEVVDENTIVAPSGRILDHRGQTAESYADGVPALLRFALPADATEFTMEVGGQRVTQNLFQ